MFNKAKQTLRDEVGMKIILCSILLLTLTGCISRYHAWDGTTGYQDERLHEGGYQVSYTAEQSTRWSWLDQYLVRRCREIAKTEQANVMDVRHEIETVVAMSSVPIGAPIMTPADSVIMPASSAPHEVVFNLKKAEGRCSF